LKNSNSIKKLQIQSRKRQQKLVESNGYSCFFCGAERNENKPCSNCHAWCATQDMLVNFFCYAVNLNFVYGHIWWIDFGVTNTHWCVYVGLSELLKTK
jgi:hypothetical protein